MTEEKKKIGVIHDPWRQSVPEPVPEVKGPLAVDLSDITEDIQDEKYTTIELKGYGGITIAGTDTKNVGAAQILEFCVDNRKAIDDVLTQYGVLLAELPVGQPGMPFYIQRHDGWTLCVPEAKTRNVGCLQLVQAMLALQADAKLGVLLKKYRIQPYKV